jgi:RecG-like helicase
MPADDWGGLPVIRKLSDAQPRTRIEVTGQVTATAQSRIADSRAYTCQLDDGTGHIIIAFTGRSNVPGVRVGARCSIEGTVQERDGSLVVFNPGYEIEATGTN